MSTTIAAMRSVRVDLATVTYGRYNDNGHLVETVRAIMDVDTGMFLEPIELGAGTWLVLMPGDLLCTVPLIVKEGRTARFDRLVATP